MERTHFEWCKEEKPIEAKTISTKMTWKKTRNDKIAKTVTEEFQNILQRLTIEWKRVKNHAVWFSYFMFLFHAVVDQEARTDDSILFIGFFLLCFSFLIVLLWVYILKARFVCLQHNKFHSSFTRAWKSALLPLVSKCCQSAVRIELISLDFHPLYFQLLLPVCWFHL